MLRPRLAALPLGLLACVLPALAPAQTTHTWQGTFIDSWSVPENWSTGQIPDAADDTVVFNNPYGSGAEYHIAPPSPPVTIGHIGVAMADAANPLVLGATSDATASLTLATTTGQPTISVASGALAIRGVLAGSQGFAKTGAGTLTFRDNPHPQLFTGPVTLGGGTLEIGADSDLGHTDNDLAVTASATLRAHPADTSVPLVLGAGRDISIPAAATIFTIHNASPTVTTELAGPLSGAGSLRVVGPGNFVFSGTDSHTGPLIHEAWPPSGELWPTGSVADSTLGFVGPEAISARGKALVLHHGASRLDHHTRIDLGGFPRSLHLSLTGDRTGTQNSVLFEFLNGELRSDGSRAAYYGLHISAGAGNSNTELRLPAVTTLHRYYMGIGINPPAPAASTTSRVRIGTRADFNLHQLLLGADGATGRLDALAPGSTLRLRDGNGTGSLPSLTIGHFAAGNTSSCSAVLDMSDGILDAQVNDIYIGNGAPPYPATAALRFGADSVLQAGNITLAGGNSSVPANFDYSVEQTGGEARLAGVLRFGESNASGNVASRYILRGGNLSLRQLSTGGNYTGSLRPRLEWSGGTISNYPSSSANFYGPNSSSPPFEIVLSTSARKALQIDTALSVPPNFKLVGTDPDIVLAKTGAGILRLSAQTQGFAGSFRLEAGTLRLDATGSTAAFHANSFAWDAGTLNLFLRATPSDSTRLELQGALTKTPAPATTRILQLNSSASVGTYPLATYASTDLTLDDFTVTGLPSGISAEFTVGPTALTVAIAPDTPFAAWRRTALASASNLGVAHDLADPDADGRPNLLEYALGSDPLAADTASPLAIALPPSLPHSLSLTFARVADPALTYSVVAADDLSGPWSGDDAEVIFSSTGEQNTAGPVTVTDSAPVSAHPRRFLRLVVTR